MPGSKLHVGSFSTCLSFQVFAPSRKKGEGAEARIPEQRLVIEPRLLEKRAKQRANENQRSQEKNKCEANALRRGGCLVRSTIVVMPSLRLCEKRQDNKNNNPCWQCSVLQSFSQRPQLPFNLTKTELGKSFFVMSSYKIRHSSEVNFSSSTPIITNVSQSARVSLSQSFPFKSRVRSENDWVRFYQKWRLTGRIREFRKLLVLSWKVSTIGF